MELVFYELPVELPVTAGNMSKSSNTKHLSRALCTLRRLDYTVGVIAAIGSFILANWLLHGKQYYKGPEVDISNTIQSDPTSELQ